MYDGARQSVYNSNSMAGPYPTPTKISRGQTGSIRSITYGADNAAAGVAQHPQQTDASKTAYPSNNMRPSSEVKVITSNLDDMTGLDLVNLTLDPESQQQVTHQSRQKPSRQKYAPDFCLECTMRDRDLADVDVGPSCWRRPSDTAYNYLGPHDILTELALKEHTIQVSCHLVVL